jgi:hypothetical protein
VPSSMSPYLEFPDEDALVERLERIPSPPSGDGLCRTIASRLAGRTIDSAAFSFMLIEILHRHESEIGEDIGSFLPRCILALTDDEDLARSARAAFRELGPPSVDRTGPGERDEGEIPK